MIGVLYELLAPPSPVGKAAMHLLTCSIGTRRDI